MPNDKEAWRQEVIDFINSLGGAREVARQWESADRSARYARTPDLVERYTGKWVAVWNCEVIATANSIAELRTTVERCAVPPMEVYTGLVEPDPPAGTLIVTPFVL